MSDLTYAEGEMLAIKVALSARAAMKAAFPEVDFHVGSVLALVSRIRSSPAGGDKASIRGLLSDVSTRVDAVAASAKDVEQLARFAQELQGVDPGPEEPVAASLRDLRRALNGEAAVFEVQGWSPAMQSSFLAEADGLVQVLLGDLRRHMSRAEPVYEEIARRHEQLLQSGRVDVDRAQQPAAQ